MKKTLPTKARVCIVIPAYNEGSVIGSVVGDITKSFTAAKQDFQIVVVNDGSKDNTPEAARQAGAHVIDHILNSGAGGATATGLSYADQNNFTIAVTMDADGQHSPDDALRGIAEIQQRQADLLIGSRLIDSKGMSVVKMIGNWGLSFITYVLFGVKTTDSQSGLRVYSRRALETLRWRTSGYEFCSEMIWRARQAGLIIDEFPIKAIYTEYSKGKGQNNWNGINIVKSLVRRRIVELFE